MPRETVLLTGASGSMGAAAFDELLRRRPRYDVVLLLRPSRRNRRRFGPHHGREGVRIVWGDLRNPDDVRRATSDVDAVLHTAAVIPPKADHHPVLTRDVNLGGTLNLLDALRERPDRGSDVRFVFIGSVAQYGDRLPPAHLLRVGDPVRPSIGDYYGVLKCQAERAVMRSGLRYWASLRQTFIAIPDIMRLMDPIMFHQPLNTHLELITAEDAGYGLVQCLEAPDDFFGRVYNMSGGPDCRVTYEEYFDRVMRIFGLGDFRRFASPRWWALRNFHCGWYDDGDQLQAALGHWRHTIFDHLRQVEQQTRWLLKTGGRLAPAVIVRAVMRQMAEPPKWIRKNDTEKITAFLGSRAAWEAGPTWPYRPLYQTPAALESEDYDALDASELAALRGGECIDDSDNRALGLRCARGHEWEAPEVELRAGHFCPECLPPDWNYDEDAKVDPLLARYHHLNHDPSEHQRVPWLFHPLDKP